MLFRSKQQKTNAEIKLPLPNEVIELGKTIKPEPYIVTARNMKTIAELCNFERLIQIDSKDSQNINQTSYKPLKELFSFHVARKSGLSALFIDNKVSASICMRISGHVTLASFWHYVGAKEDIESSTMQLLNLS